MIPISAPLLEFTRDAYPLPIADAVERLASAGNIHEQRDRVVEVFRTVLRYQAALALAARITLGTGPGTTPEGVDQCLHTLRTRGLTDGQWVQLLRELLRPWSEHPDRHALPSLVALWHSRDRSFVRLVDELLGMRKSETVAHGSTGDERSLLPLVERRIEQVQQLLTSSGELFRTSRLVCTLSPPTDVRAHQSAWVLQGVTRASGRWHRFRLPPGERHPAGEVLLLAQTGTVLLSMHPVCLFRAPSPTDAMECFFLDAGSKRGGAYISLPAIAHYREKPAWTVIEACLYANPLEDAPIEGLPANPFRGLDSFDSAHHQLFFGRDRLSRELGNQIRKSPWVTVIGASGAGKSSLMRAGVLPSLQSAYPVLVDFRPGSHPEAALAHALTAALGTGWDEGRLDLSTRPAELGSLLFAWSTNRQSSVLILVDQGEEVFTLCGDAGRRNRLGTALASVAEAAPHTVRIVWSMREDFFAEASDIPPLRRLFSQRVVVVGAPTAEQLLETILGPLGLYGYALEDGRPHAEAMVAEVEGAPAALALLQFCAAQWWEERDRRWKQLTTARYEAMGGVLGALTRHADHVIAQMPMNQKHMARDVLLALVDPDSRTRRVVPRVQVTSDAADIEPVLSRLEQARLIVARDGFTNEGPVVELIHEALVSHWSTLTGWLEEDREGQRIRHSLSTAAATWEHRGRPPDLLWRGDLLTELEAWQRRTKPRLAPISDSFARQSTDAFMRQRHRRRVVIGAVIALLSVFCVFAAWQWSRAEQGQRVAEAARDLADEARMQSVGRTLLAELRKRQALGQPMAGTEGLMAWTALRLASDPDSPLAVEARTAVDELWLSRVASVPLGGHRDVVERIAHAPDGGSLATASRDRTAIVWDAATGDLLHRLEGHAGAVVQLAFSPDGSRIATASRDGTARIWSTATGTLHAELRAHTDEVSNIAWAPDGQQLATVGWDGQVIVWNPDNGQIIHRIAGHEGQVNAVVYAPDGGRIFSAGSDNTAAAWNTGSGALERRFQGHEAALTTLTLSKDGALLVTAGLDGTARVWTLAEPSASPIVIYHGDEVYSVAVSPGGGLLATGGRDGRALRWNLETGMAMASTARHTAPVYRVVWAPDRALLSASDDGTVLRQSTSPDAPVHQWRHGTVGLMDIEVSADGRWVDSVGRDGVVRRWSSRGGEAIWTAPAQQQATTAAVFATLADQVATGDARGQVQIWDAHSGSHRDQATAHGGPVQQLVNDPTGSRLASAAVGDPVIRWWSWTEHITSSTARTIPDRTICCLAAHPFGPAWTVAGLSGAMHTWSALDDPAAPVVAQVAATPVVALFVGPTGERVTGHPTGEVQVWSSDATEASKTRFRHRGTVSFAAHPEQTGFASMGTQDIAFWTTPVTTPHAVVEDAHEDTLTAAAYTTDGAALVTGALDGSIAQWEPRTGVLVWRTSSTEREPVHSVATAKDGSVWTGHESGAVRVWSTEGAAIRTLQGHTDPVEHILANEDGKTILTISKDVARLWTLPLPTRDEVAELGPQRLPMRSCEAAPLTIVSVDADALDSTWAPKDRCEL